MCKSSSLIILLLVCASFVNAQNKPLVFDGSEIGYFDDSGTPVVTANLTKEQADSFRAEYKKFIYLPKTQKTLAIDSTHNFSTNQISRDETSSGKLLTKAGQLYNLSNTIGISGGLIGSLLISEGEIVAGAITTGLSSIVALLIEFKANSVLMEAGDQLENEISTIKSIHLKSDAE